jgi:hypothetical protein
MKRPLILLLTILFMVSCGDPNTTYVKKAVRIMDKHGIYAQGPEWETAKQEALEAQPSTLKEAQEIVINAGKVAGGKHTFLLTTDECQYRFCHEISWHGTTAHDSLSSGVVG